MLPTVHCDIDSEINRHAGGERRLSPLIYVTQMCAIYEYETKGNVRIKTIWMEIENVYCCFRETKCTGLLSVSVAHN